MSPDTSNRVDLDRRASFSNPVALAVMLFISLVLVVAFSIWVAASLFTAIRFRDDLIAGEYEGSLSSDLGFLLALTSEASRIRKAVPQDHLEAIQNLKHDLLEARDKLQALTPLPGLSQIQRSVIDLPSLSDESQLRQILADDTYLGTVPLSELGLIAGTRDYLPDYPFLITRTTGDSTRSLVFVPSPSVERPVSGPNASLALRRELVFSRIAEEYLRDLKERHSTLEISYAYYLSCSDFIRLVPPAPIGDPGFSPLRSFVDRTYFRETLAAPTEARESPSYLDVTGYGFTRTISVFVNNSHFKLCGMLAVDIDDISGADLWENLALGSRPGGLQDFMLARYHLDTGRIEPNKHWSATLDKAVLQKLQQVPYENLRREVRREVIDDATLFSVPLGKDGAEAPETVGLLVFDAKAQKQKYRRILIVGLLAIVIFIIMVALIARSFQAARTSARLQEQILENLHSGFVIVDTGGRIIGATERFVEMVNTPSVGRRPEEFLTPDSAAEYQKKAGSSRFEFAGRLRRANGEERPVILTSAPLSLPGRNELRMLTLIPSSQLEVAIAKKFLNMFSHTLKSPVHGILIIADLFRRRNAMPRFDEYYSKLYGKVQEFRLLTDNVLRFSAIEVKDIQIEWASVNIAHVLRQTLATAQEKARSRGLLLIEDIPDSLRVKADAGLLGVVFNNIIDNALKYTKVGYIRVRAKDLLTHVRVTVEDSGPGVPAADRERIFELFYQGAGTEVGTHEGLGLGLYISRQYLRAMKASLRFEPMTDHDRPSGMSGGGPGSRFVVELEKSTKET